MQLRGAKKQEAELERLNSETKEIEGERSETETHVQKSASYSAGHQQEKSKGEKIAEELEAVQKNRIQQRAKLSNFIEAYRKGEA